MLVVYSHSSSFEDHVKLLANGEVTIRSVLSPAVACAGCVYVVHAPSFTREIPGWLEKTCKSGAVVAIADDKPGVASMLRFTSAGVNAYFNSYMAAPHYAQMIRLLTSGNSWFPPALLTQAFELARTAIPNEDRLEILTERERQIALAVAEGKNNKLIADECNITERTVKSHLTNIFKKLDINDRVSLVVYLKQAGI